jgi:LPXTG-site transpeptidase (sortase) family protein
MVKMLKFSGTAVKKTTRFRKLELVFLVLGIIALGIYGGARIYSSAYQSYVSYSFKEQFRGRSPSLKGFVGYLFGKSDNTSQPVHAKKQVSGTELLRSMIYAPEIVPDGKGWSADRLRAYKNAAPPLSGSVLGRLEIASLDLNVMLLQGTDDWTLNRAVGHIEGTALPGKPGNLGIAGHRDGFFRCLKDIGRNDIITITTLDGRYYYRVNKIQILKPENVEVLAPTRAPTLTLVTCYPFHYVGNAPKRYVVTAEITKVESASEIAAVYADSGIK